MPAATVPMAPQVENSKQVAKPRSAEKWSTLADVEVTGKRIAVHVDERRLRATVSIYPIAKAFAIKASEMTDLLEERGIVLSDDKRKVLDEFVKEVNEPDFDLATLAERAPILVAEGIAPIEGVDGYLEWNVDVAEDGGVKLKVDERGNVDFREMHAVVNVREADFLVTVHEPTVAEPGVDVFGHPIPARQGQKTVISRGHGVKASEDGRQLFAEIEGHVGWKRRTLTVEPVYVVNGNVDFAVGNINFNGSVHVTKDVADGFVVQARDSVEVAGTVGGSKVIAGQSVHVRGGVAAKEQGYISAGDAVITKFLNNAAVDCGGDLTVDTQIVNSTINCAGCVRAPNARIVGGAVVALAGMELGEVGTPGGTRTQLRVTIEGFQNAEIREIDAQIAQLKEAAEKIRVRIAPLLEDPAKIKALNQQQREVVKTLAQKMNAGKKEIDALVAQRADLARAFAAKLKPEINVKRVLHPGVEILIDECRAILNEPVIGPVRLKPNYTTMGIAISS